MRATALTMFLCLGPSLASTSASASSYDCPSGDRVTFDFATDDTGSPLVGGSYVSQEWKTRYGMTVVAFGHNGGGFTPGNGPRLFDTANPGAFRSLGSPHHRCDPRGPGSGGGGKPGAAGENCDPLGLALIIQNEDTEYGEAYPGGGSIVFLFDRPTVVHSVGVFDINNSKSKVIVTKSLTKRPFVTKIHLPRLGHNSAQTVDLGLEEAIGVEVWLEDKGAVSHLDLCILSTDPPSMVPSNGPSAIPTETPCEPEVLVSSETFEQDDNDEALLGWTNGKLDYAPGFSNFLGRFIGTDPYPSKVYDVSPTADSIWIKVDFYQIDSWNKSGRFGPDSLSIAIDGEEFDLGTFDSRMVTTARSGMSPNGIVWSLDSHGPPRHIGFRDDDVKFQDQIHTISIEVPPAFFADGTIELEFRTLVTAVRLKDESAGFDNIRIIEWYNCNPTAAPQTPIPTECGDTHSPTPVPTGETSPPTPRPTGETEPPTPMPTRETEPPTPYPTRETEEPTPNPTGETEPPSPKPTRETQPPTPEPTRETAAPTPWPTRQTKPPTPKPTRETEPPTPKPTRQTKPPTPKPTRETAAPTPWPTRQIKPPTPEPTRETEPPTPEPTRETEPPTPEPTRETAAPTPYPTRQTEPPTPWPTRQTEPPSPKPTRETEPPTPKPTRKTEPPTPRPTNETKLPTPWPTRETAAPTPWPTRYTYPPTPWPTRYTYPPTPRPTNETKPPTSRPTLRPTPRPTYWTKPPTPRPSHWKEPPTPWPTGHTYRPTPRPIHWTNSPTPWPTSQPIGARPTLLPTPDPTIGKLPTLVVFKTHEPTPNPTVGKIPVLTRPSILMRHPTAKPTSVSTSWEEVKDDELSDADMDK